ncbi:MAG: DUF2726 domain-containing protein [Burkholderiales bacterium]|nr:DUF2726 domain-containing protein [Burkholderiales bacterium]
MDIPQWLVAASIALLAGVALGALAQRAWNHRVLRLRRRLPTYWPLSTRAIANSEERRVWRWLTRAFFDHHVMLKLPMTRFTAPRDRSGGQDWYELLNSAYCTFTICSSDGRVVGCVDVPGNSGISKTTRMLKQSLLEQSDIGYWVVTSGSLPSTRDIRTEFLGDALGALEPRTAVAPGPAAAIPASSASRPRPRIGQIDPMAGDPARFTRVPGEEFDPEGEPNSFLAPLDSRLGPLA